MARLLVVVHRASLSSSIFPRAQNCPSIRNAWSWLDLIFPSLKNKQKHLEEARVRSIFEHSRAN